MKLLRMMVLLGLTMSSFSILAKLNDPHLEDDFHRFLVQYVLKFNEKASKKFGSYKETFRATDATLFQVTLQTEKITDTREQNNQSNQFQVIQQNIQMYCILLLRIHF